MTETERKNVRRRERAMGLLGGVGGDKSCTATSLTLPLQRSRQAEPQLCSLSSATAAAAPAVATVFHCSLGRRPQEDAGGHRHGPALRAGEQSLSLTV